MWVRVREIHSFIPSISCWNHARFRYKSSRKLKAGLSLQLFIICGGAHSSSHDSVSSSWCDQYCLTKGKVCVYFPKGPWLLLVSLFPNCCIRSVGIQQFNVTYPERLRFWPRTEGRLQEILLLNQEQQRDRMKERKTGDRHAIVCLVIMPTNWSNLYSNKNSAGKEKKKENEIF